MIKTLNDIKIIDIPKIIDSKGRGKLSFIEKNIVPFEIKRVYYLYDVPLMQIEEVKYIKIYAN